MGGISHIFTNPQADGTNASIVRPSDWNSIHTYNLQDAVSLAGNTAGVLADVSTGRLILAGGNNITLSQNGNSVSVSAGNYLTTAMLSNASTQFVQANAGFNGTNASGTIASNSISVSVAAQSSQSAIKGFGVSNTGQTAGNTGISTGINWVLAGSGSITLSQSTAGGGPNTVWIQHPAWLTTAMQSNAATISNVNISAGTTSNNLSALTFSNLNGVSFGLNGSVLTGSVAAVGGAQTAISGIVVSDTTYTSGTVSFSNQANVTIGSSVNGATQYIRLSVAAQSVESQSIGASNLGNTQGTSGVASGGQVQFVIAGTNNVSLSQSVNGASATVTIDAGPVLSRFHNFHGAGVMNLFASVANSLFVFPIHPFGANVFPGHMTVSTILIPVSAASANTSQQQWTLNFGVYTQVNSTALGMVWQAASTLNNAAATNNTTGWNGVNFLSIHSSLVSDSASNTTTPFLSAGVRYWGAICCNSAVQTKGLSFYCIQLEPANWAASNLSGSLQVAGASNTSIQPYPFYGAYASAALPQSISKSSISNTAGSNLPLCLIFENDISKY